jgi:hypothetical protein
MLQLENQAINPERIGRLQNTLERSKQLIKTISSPEFDKYAKEIANGGFIPEGDEPYIPTLSTIPSKNSAEYATKAYNNNNNNIATSPNINTKMPKAILESFMSNPIEPPQGNLAELDALFSNSTPAPVNSTKPAKKTEAIGFSNYINENTQQMQSAQIDYSLIKMIVKECVNEAIEKYMKDADNVNLIRLGDNIKFLTKDGSLYEGKLNYKGNVKEKLNESKK